MSARKKEEQIEDVKRQLTELHVTMGLIRAAVQHLDSAVQTKDKDAFKDALNKLKVYAR